MNTQNTRILFVCMGNICRSPTAEGVMHKFVQRAGFQNRIHVDSAGTHDYYKGAPPDIRAQTAAYKRGYDLALLRARQLEKTDFETFDLLLAMDHNNLGLLQSMCTRAHQSKVRLLMNYSSNLKSPIVPDPYRYGPRKFETVLDYIEDACNGLMKAISHHAATSQ